MNRSSVVRVAVFLATVVASWAVLSLGSAATTPVPPVGQLAPQTYFADKEAEVVDVDETERLKQEERDLVEEPRRSDTEIEATVIAGVVAVFDDVQALAIGDPPPGSNPEIPELPPVETPSTTQPPEGSTTTTQPPDPSVVSGLLYIDVEGDGGFSFEGPGVPIPGTEDRRFDQGLGAVTVNVSTHDEDTTIVTGDDGSWTFEYPGGPVVISVDLEDTSIPALVL